MEDYGDLVLRLGYSYLGSRQDAEDVCQTVFLKLLEKGPVFVSPDHEKAWLIRTTKNACKDLLKSHWRKTTVDMDAALPLAAPEPAEDRVLAALATLPPKYRAVLYLCYYEGYGPKDLGTLLGRPAATISTQLRRGRELLRKALEKEDAV